MVEVEVTGRHPIEEYLTWLDVDDPAESEPEEQDASDEDSEDTVCLDGGKQ